jgi:hypothetical protein
VPTGLIRKALAEAPVTVPAEPQPPESPAPSSENKGKTNKKKM